MKQHDYVTNLHLCEFEENGTFAPLSQVTTNFLPDRTNYERPVAIVDLEFLIQLGKQMASAHFTAIRNGIASRIHEQEDMPTLMETMERELVFLKSIALVTGYTEPIHKAVYTDIDEREADAAEREAAEMGLMEA